MKRMVGSQRKDWPIVALGWRRPIASAGAGAGAGAAADDVELGEIALCRPSRGERSGWRYSAMRWKCKGRAVR